MFNVLLLDNISSKGLSLFKPDTYKLSTSFKDPDVILVRSHRLHDYPFLKQLKAVGRAGVGTDNIPVAQLTELGIPVFFSPGANANAVKELTLAAILISYRHLDAARKFLTNLLEDKTQFLSREIETQKKKFVGYEISGKTLGVIGLGNIGVKIANAALALGMRVLAYDPNMTLSNALALMPAVEKTINMNAVLANSDIITLHVPLTAETSSLINKENINSIKQGALLLNFSREEVVDEIAIKQHLDKQNLMGYITDFPTIHLASHPRVLSFPHLGASTVEAEQNSAAKVVRNICNYLEFGVIEDSVNFPNTLLTPIHLPDCHRLVIINHNKPGAIALMTEIISQLGLNIEQMVNTSRDAIAVNLIDVSGAKERLKVLKTRMRAIPSVIRMWVYPYVSMK